MMRETKKIESFFKSGQNHKVIHHLKCHFLKGSKISSFWLEILKESKYSYKTNEKWTCFESDWKIQWKMDVFDEILKGMEHTLSKDQNE